MKSLRPRSAIIPLFSSPPSRKLTLPGLLPSEYSPSLLSVVTCHSEPSPRSSSNLTITVPKLAPTISDLGKMDFICSGLRVVAISMSSGLPPERESLTHPPTIHALPLSPSLFSTILSTLVRLPSARSIDSRVGPSMPYRKDS